MANTHWQLLSLPEDMTGKSFLDVGCWEGTACVEAMARGASTVVGLDLCTSTELHANLARHPFTFIQADILSEKIWGLPSFDVVLCSGVLYHVEEPLLVIMRLRKLCRDGGSLYLETTVHTIGPADKPLLLFHPDDSLDHNPSNWWTPNELGLLEMLRAAGFSELETVYRSGAERSIGRICVRARASSTADDVTLKILPRRPEYMPTAEGRGSRIIRKT